MRCTAFCQRANSRRGGEPPPGITTAPTYGAWKTRNGVAEKYDVSSTSSAPKRTSGLSEPNRSIASVKTIRRNGAVSSMPTESKIRVKTVSPIA